MSFTGQIYDECAYAHNLKQSQGTFEYINNTPNTQCDDCFFTNPRVRIDKQGANVCSSGIGGLTDADSEMLGITRKLSHCPKDFYLPTADALCQKKQLRDCDPIGTEDTRYSNPPCTLRGTNNGFNRWTWLPTDPQVNEALEPFPRTGTVNTDLMVKDNHRPCVPNPMDQTSGLPNGGPECVDFAEKFKRGTNPHHKSSINWRSCNEIAKY
jgi:hypothetical protein